MRGAFATARWSRCRASCAFCAWHQVRQHCVCRKRERSSHGVAVLEGFQDGSVDLTPFVIVYLLHGAIAI